MNQSSGVDFATTSSTAANSTVASAVGSAAANEKLLEARFAAPLALARAAYHPGNRHVTVEAGREP
ncbi:MAG: hypothetical protein LBS40_04040 [Burkholderiales bacterium]|nr:hypothetical protein [Burkholderiales bacterium]